MDKKNNICCSPQSCARVLISSQDSECAKKINNCLVDMNGIWICPVLLHGIVPYYLTFMKNGAFSWMRNKNKVVMQCPQTDYPCVVELKRVYEKNKSKKILMKVLNISPDCHIKLNKNQIIDLSSLVEGKVCLLGLDSIFPYLEYLTKNSSEEISLKCACLEKSSVINLKIKDI